MSVHSSPSHPEDPSIDGQQMHDSTPVPVKVDWKMLVIVVVIIVFIREISVWLMAQMGYANLGNFLGLLLLFGFAMAYRISQGEIPSRLVAANSTILKEGIFAFLPICAGIGTLLAGLGNDAFKILLIMLISTLIPLRLYAYIVKKWL
jgi:putative effector of murein hydrolase LrgA (UPF0299 family)